MNEERTLEAIGATVVVVIPRAEYNELINARLGIDLIGCTLGKFGPNDDIVKAVCKQFGYEYKEETPDA